MPTAVASAMVMDALAWPPSLTNRAPLTAAVMMASRSTFTAAEREQLTALLRRLAADQGLSEQSLPGIPRRG